MDKSLSGRSAGAVRCRGINQWQDVRPRYDLNHNLAVCLANIMWYGAAPGDAWLLIDRLDKVSVAQ